MQHLLFVSTALGKQIIYRKYFLVNFLNHIKLKMNVSWFISFAGILGKNYFKGKLAKHFF